MKTKLPLPRKQDEYVLESKTASLGWPFEDSANFGVYFKQADIDYVEKNITSHKAYRLIKQRMQQNKHGSDMCVQFFDSFRKDQKCPEKVRAFLDAYIGWMYYTMNKYKENTSTLKQFFMDRWMEKCI